MYVCITQCFQALVRILKRSDGRNEKCSRIKIKFLKKGVNYVVRGKTINGLMRLLRDKHGIEIGGSIHKKELLNMGYFHGYKGYRFIKKSERRIPYTDFDEVIAIYEFDTKIKSLFYPYIMLIETAFKNYTLDAIIAYGSSDFDHIFSNLLDDYKKHSTGSKKYKKKMKSRLDLRNKIYSNISYNYNSNKPVIQHYFHANKPIPLWAIFEVINLGEFGFFIHCLNGDVRIKIARDLDIHSTSHNQNGRIFEDIIFLLKDLRNTIAHNSVIFDCRYKASNPPSRLIQFIQMETGVRDIMFENIVDYLIIHVYILKKLGIRKTELKRLVRSFTVDSERLRKKIPTSVHTSIMGSDLKNKLVSLRNFI